MLSSRKAVSNVPVYMNSRPNEYEDSIMISGMKLDELAFRHGEMYKFAPRA